MFIISAACHVELVTETYIQSLYIGDADEYKNETLPVVFDNGFIGSRYQIVSCILAN